VVQTTGSKDEGSTKNQLQLNNYWLTTSTLLWPTRESISKCLSGPCDHCALCGNYGKHNKSVVPYVSQTMSKPSHSNKTWHAQSMVFM